MPTYYVSGIPFSDDLYHSGVKGQKWGIRRYQNEDGTLTPLGRLHYGAQAVGGAIGKAGKAVGRAGKAAVNYEVKQIKRRHPSLMSDKEIDEELARSKKINQISKERAEARGRRFAGKLSALVWKTAGVGTEKFAENWATTVGKKAAENMMLSADEREEKYYKNKRIALDEKRRYYEAFAEEKPGSYRSAEKKYKEAQKKDRRETYEKIKGGAKKGYSKAKSGASKVRSAAQKANQDIIEEYYRNLEKRRKKEEQRNRASRLTSADIKGA